MAAYLRAPHLGRRYFPRFHDRHIPSQKIICHVDTPDTAARRHHLLVMAYRQGAEAAQQIRHIKLGVRSAEGRGYCGCPEVESWTSRHLVSEVTSCFRVDRMVFGLLMTCSVT
jgi:hypothetical protein